MLGDVKDRPIRRSATPSRPSLPPRRREPDGHAARPAGRACRSRRQLRCARAACAKKGPAFPPTPSVASFAAPLLRLPRPEGRFGVARGSPRRRQTGGETPQAALSPPIFRSPRRWLGLAFDEERRPPHTGHGGLLRATRPEGPVPLRSWRRLPPAFALPTVRRPSALRAQPPASPRRTLPPIANDPRPGPPVGTPVPALRRGTPSCDSPRRGRCSGLPSCRTARRASEGAPPPCPARPASDPVSGRPVTASSACPWKVSRPSSRAKRDLREPPVDNVDN